MEINGVRWTLEAARSQVYLRSGLSTLDWQHVLQDRCSFTFPFRWEPLADDARDWTRVHTHVKHVLCHWAALPFPKGSFTKGKLKLTILLRRFEQKGCIRIHPILSCFYWHAVYSGVCFIFPMQCTSTISKTALSWAENVFYMQQGT